MIRTCTVGRFDAGDARVEADVDVHLERIIARSEAREIDECHGVLASTRLSPSRVPAQRRRRSSAARPRRRGSERGCAGARAVLGATARAAPATSRRERWPSRGFFSRNEGSSTRWSRFHVIGSRAPVTDTGSVTASCSSDGAFRADDFNRRRVHGHLADDEAGRRSAFRRRIDRHRLGRRVLEDHGDARRRHLHDLHTERHAHLLRRQLKDATARAGAAQIENGHDVAWPDAAQGCDDPRTRTSTSVGASKRSSSPGGNCTSSSGTRRPRSTVSSPATIIQSAKASASESSLQPDVTERPE